MVFGGTYDVCLELNVMGEWYVTDYLNLYGYINFYRFEDVIVCVVSMLRGSQRMWYVESTVDVYMNNEILTFCNLLRNKSESCCCLKVTRCLAQPMNKS